ncbi:MAG: glycerophosphodiester phosphodiesterase [Vulcanimicrobiota bacterium]
MLNMNTGIGDAGSIHLSLPVNDIAFGKAGMSDPSDDALSQTADVYSSSRNMPEKKPFIIGHRGASSLAGGIIGFFTSKEIGKKLSLKDSQDKGADIIIPYWATLDKQWVQDMHAQGTMVFAYTADKPKLVHKLLDYYGVDGIITNNPERFVSGE